jgi:hypothetical protein
MKKPVPFGKYYLLERINVGGMAEVFKAKAFGVEGFERLVAVKRILPNIAEDEEFIAMFIDEAKIAVQLQHANIAQIFDLGKVEDSYFIALEYVRGKDLRAIFDRVRQRNEVMPIAQSCYLMMQVCEGLDYAHNKRDAQGKELHLVHRDISPQNVLCGYEGEIKLIDFGIAKAAGKASKTQAGILKGKFGYMSPEQVRGLPIDRRSDIFSVGIVLYELLTGERLFMGESDFSTLEKVRNVEILPPSSYNKKIPEELERIALKALAKDPEDRYQNAIDLHDDLQAFLYTQGELYSRKDLAAWMKKNFPAEIEEENVKMEQFRQVVAPAAAPAGALSPRKTIIGTGMAAAGLPGGGAAVEASAGAGGAVTGRSGRPDGAKGRKGDGKRDGKSDGKGGAKADGKGEGMGWDDEELDTQIFEKEETGEPEMLDSRDIFDDDDDRTVANEPPPDILRAATAPDLATPAPRRTGAHGGLNATPFPGPGRPQGPPIGTPRTLFGMPAPGLPAPSSSGRVSGAYPLPPGSGRTARPTGPVTLPPYPGAPPPPPRPTGMRPASFDLATETSLPAMSPGASRAKVYSVLAVLAVLGVGGTAAYYYWSLNRAGKLEITTTPPDATILVDNVKVADRSPFILDRPPGPYNVSVARPGYVRNEQSVEIKAGLTANLVVTLDAAAENGFDLTSEPPGQLVWLDGNPMMTGSDGQQARTGFRAYRIAPGKHVIEIKNDPRFKPWREEIEVEPGVIKKVKAVLIAVEGGKTGPTTPPPTPPSGDRGPGPGPTVELGPDGRTDPGPGTTTPKTQRRRPKDDDGTSTPSTRTPRGVVEEEEAGGATETCSITVGTRPWSELWIDGKNTGRHTPYSESISCGKHKLVFKRPDLSLERTEVVNVRPGEKFRQVFPLEQDESE